MSHTPHHI
ncbi:hypothetical protein E2C01_095489 [Portunus trituberculatus]|uniref:Uncharacterized protein n=1 Tax=Portunus trituberculatus TaxID=210409 RepID=A0A5B7JT57_PORTR|nr:hypothetical protein [Portunus trituberculatus]